MKNLQKTLSLVLAMVMIFGMFAVTANAAEVTDLDTVGTKYVEAVQVVNGMGIIEGDENGVFNPKGEITRAGMAKLISYIVLGKEGAEGLNKNATQFTDVKAGEWYAGYINYCYNAGYLIGNGDGTFSPDAGISGYGVGKLLLSALGYGKNGEYVGEGWEMKVAQDALRTGIFGGNVGGLNENVATREEVALYIYNTLQAAPVTYLAALDLYTSTNLPGTLAELVGYGEIVGTVEGVITKNTAIEEDLNDEDLGALTEVDGVAYVFESALEDLGTYVKVIYGDINDVDGYDADEDKVYAVITLSTKVEVAKAIDKADAYKKAFGSEETIATAATKSFDGAYAPSADFVADGKNASVGTYHIYKKAIKGYVAPLAESLEEVKEIKTDAGKTKIYTENVGTALLKGGVETKYVVGADAVAKDDIVLVARTGDYYTVKKAESVQGQVTYRNTTVAALNALTLDGTVYSPTTTGTNNVTITGETSAAGIPLASNTTKLYLDSNGKYIKVVLVDTSVASDIVFVNAVYTTAAGVDAYGDDVGPKAYAQIVKMDGTVETVLIDVAERQVNGDWYWEAAERTAAPTLAKGLYTYKAHVATSATDPLKGTYEFTTAYTVDAVKAYGKTIVLSETLEMTPVTTKIGTAYVTADTKIIYVDGEKSTIDVKVKGLTNNNIANQTVYAVVAKDAQGNEIAQYVVVADAYDVAATSDLIYLADATADGANALGSVYKCYLNGVSSELVIDNASTSGLFPYTVDENGVYTLESRILADGTNVYLYEKFSGLYGTKINSNSGAMVDIEAADAVIVDTVNTPEKKISTLEGMLAADETGDVYFHAVTTGTGASKKVTTIYIVNNAVQYVVGANQQIDGVLATAEAVGTDSVELILNRSWNSRAFNITATKNLTIKAGANGATLKGGLTINANGKTVTVEGVTFETNGLVIYGGKKVTVKNNKFSAITVADAIAVDSTTTSLTITGNTIDGVTADGQYAGIRVDGVSGTTTISKNVVKNIAHNAIVVLNYDGGAVEGTIKITDNTLTNWGVNETENGRAVRVYYATADAVDLTISGNTFTHTNAPEEVIKVNPNANTNLLTEEEVEAIEEGNTFAVDAEDVLVWVYVAP